MNLLEEFSMKQLLCRWAALWLDGRGNKSHKLRCIEEKNISNNVDKTKNSFR